MMDEKRRTGRGASKQEKNEEFHRVAGLDDESVTAFMPVHFLNFKELIVNSLCRV